MKKTKFSLTVILTGIVLTLAAAADANIIYFNDFESAVGSEWSNTSTDITPAGGRGFLGQFAGDDSVSLSLDNLPVHDFITVSFDLFAIQSWDGTSNEYGQDFWQLSVNNGPVLLNTTFSNTGEDSHMQSYPGDYSDGVEYPAYTGAAEINTLGYGFYGDSVYRFNFTFDHFDNSLTFNFAGFGLQGVCDESWGLDNITVTADSFNVPEPSSVVFTMLSLFFCRRRGGQTV